MHSHIIIMHIALGSDHAGYKLKEAVKTYLLALGHKVADYGSHSDERADYPDFAHPVAAAIAAQEAELGILVCGSGNGVCMTANKHAGIRAALAWQPELAQLARAHNDANILCLPERFISIAEGLAMVDLFLITPFEGGRHQARIAKQEL